SPLEERVRRLDRRLDCHSPQANWPEANIARRTEKNVRDWDWAAGRGGWARAYAQARAWARNPNRPPNPKPTPVLIGLAVRTRRTSRPTPHRSSRPRRRSRG